MKKDTQYELDKLNRILEKLPDFCTSYVQARALKISVRTSISYANDYITFLNYLIRNHRSFHKYKIKDFGISDLKILTVEDIDGFIQYQVQRGNGRTTILRRLSAVSTLYEYLLKRKYVSHNPVTLIERKKENKKPVIRLETDETSKFIGSIQNGIVMADSNSKNKPFLLRDMAIFITFLNQGLRVSELRNIDLDDINFEDKSLGVIRKGGNYQKIYLSDETVELIKKYLDVREYFLSESMSKEDRNALFLSRKHKRIGVRQIEMLTKKYLETSVPEKKGIITPHKLRSTFAMDYYGATNDILSLQKILGHSHIQTTTIYAEATDKAIRESRNIVSEKRQ